MRKLIFTSLHLYIFTFLSTLLGGVGGGLAFAQKPFVVVLDAGHGGQDAGAVGADRSNREKDINLAITLKVGELLRQNCPDVKVIYTRDADFFVTLDGRAKIANKAKADIFVSIHTNAVERTPGRQPVGVQSYTLTLRTAGTNLEVEKRENSVIQFEADGQQKYMLANNGSSESDIMFELMQDRDMQESVNLAKLCQDEMVQTGGRNDMGVLQANLAVLRLTYMPSVLLEVGFISTDAEAQFLMTDAGRTIMAKSIYNAISRYKTQHTGRMSNLQRITSEELQQANEGAQEGKESAADSLHNASPVPQSTASTSDHRPVFKVQLFASKRQFIEGSTPLQGFEPIYYKEGDLYKYTYGETTDYNEIVKLRKKAQEKFPECFVIAFKDGVRIDATEAVKEWRSKQ